MFKWKKYLEMPCLQAESMYDTGEIKKKLLLKAENLNQKACCGSKQRNFNSSDKKNFWSLWQINVHSGPPNSKETVQKNDLEVSASSFSAPTHTSFFFICMLHYVNICVAVVWPAVCVEDFTCYSARIVSHDRICVFCHHTPDAGTSHTTNQAVDIINGLFLHW